MLRNWIATRPKRSALRTFSILSSRKRASSGRTPSLSQVSSIDGGVGLGDAELAGPGELVEGREPGELLAHIAKHLGTHVGEDGREEAGILQGGDPGEHRLIDGDPHEDIVFDECVDLRGGEGEAGVAGKFGPVAAAVEVAEVVIVAIAPVKALEGVAVEAGELEEALVRGGVLGAEDFTVVEDDGADH